MTFTAKGCDIVKLKFKRKKEKDKDSLSFREIFRYNLTALKMVQRASSWYIPITIIMCTISSVINFYSYTWTIRYILNGFQTGEDKGNIIRTILIIFGIQLLSWIVQDIYYALINVKMTNNITKYVRKTLFKKAGEVDLECYENPDFYDKYVKAMDEASDRVFAVISSLTDIVWLVMSVILNGGILIVIDPFLVLFAIFPILFGLLRKKELKVYYKYVADQKPIDRRKNYIRRTFYLNDYAKEMRLTDMAPSQIRHFKELYGKYKVILRKHGVKRTILGFLGECSGDLISSVGSLLYAVFRTVVSRTMLIGDCAVTIEAIQTLNSYLNSSVTDIAAFAEHALYLRDMNEFLNYVPKIKENENGLIAKPGVIRFENVCFAYTGSDKNALDNLSFTIAPDEKIALVGCNGAGKSTIVKLLLHLYEPTQGRITLNGVDIKEYNLTSYRSLFSTLFQDYKSFSLSVAENVAKRPLIEGDREKVESALTLSGIGEKISTFSNGVDSILTKEFDPDGIVMSGGETQKLQLASVFFSGAHFALLDEPSSALDPIAEYKMFEGMINATQGKSVIFISHRLSSAVIADKIVVIDNGCVAQIGNHAELMHSGGLYSEMFNRQAENYVDSPDADSNN